MVDFKFVTLTNPDEIKEKRHQSVIRGHAIRTSAKKMRVEAVRSRNNFVVVEIDPRDHRPKKRHNKDKPRVVQQTLSRSLSSSRMDPFDSLPACPERLRILMRNKNARQAGEPVFCWGGDGKMYFQGIHTIFEGALADPALFHALSLVLALATNRNVPNVECLMHRGELLNCLRYKVGNPDALSQLTTLTGILLLIGYEYRMDGPEARASIPMHVRAVDEVLKVGQKVESALHCQIRRALFWQDLCSCLMLGTTRLLSHEDFPEWCWTRDPTRWLHYVVPPGFTGVINMFPHDFAILLEDHNALCTLIDACCKGEDGHSAIFQLRVDDAQAWMESRITDLLAIARNLGEMDPVYEAILFTIYLCTYKLSTFIWEGCYIPEWIASHIWKVLTKIPSDVEWQHSPQLLLWLLFAGAAFVSRRATRLQYRVLILGRYEDVIGTLHEDWQSTRDILRQFVWSEQSMEARYYKFWEELHPRADSESAKIT